MIRITRAGNGYKMTFSPGIPGQRGWSVKARTLGEVHEAIDHYLGSADSKERYEHSGEARQATCPLCRKVSG